MHVPPIPAIVKVPPFEAKPLVDLTVSVPPERAWLAPLTVVVSGCWLTVVVRVTVALSAGVPLQPVMPLNAVPDALV